MARVSDKSKMIDRGNGKGTSMMRTSEPIKNTIKPMKALSTGTIMRKTRTLSPLGASLEKNKAKTTSGRSQGLRGK